MTKLKIAGISLFCCMILTSVLPLAAAESRTESKSVENQTDWERLDRLYKLIQTYKESDTEIPDEAYTQFFELQNQLEPEFFRQQGEGSGDRGSLDQGHDMCPGFVVNHPANGPWTWNDYGTTANYANNCTYRSGRDVVYQITMNHTDSLQITTCGSGFDTYLYVYANACCTGSPVFVSDDNSICGNRSLQSAIRGCFNANTTYYIVVDGFRFASSYGSYQLHITSATGLCGPIQPPPVQCPDNFNIHTELEVDEECGEGYTTVCGDRWCGTINAQGDIDAYSITITNWTILVLTAYGDDTPGHSGFNQGLDPVLNLYPSSCDGPIQTNNNYNGEGESAPHGNDSRIIRCCASPGTYWILIGGNSTTGPYEFFVDCGGCDSR